MRVHRGCPFVRSTRLLSSRINPKTHSETSILKQVFCIHSGMGLRNAVGNRGLRVRPAPVCRLYTLMRPQFMGLCAHAVWVYVFAVYGLMRPYRTGLCARSLRAYAPIPYGSMHPYHTGLCAHTVWVYAPAVYGLMRPCCMGLCVRSLWGCVPVFQEAMASHFTELYLLRRDGLYPITPAVLPRRIFQAADIFDAGIETLCQISQVLHDDLIGAERFRAIRHT